MKKGSNQLQEQETHRMYDINQICPEAFRHIDEKENNFKWIQNVGSDLLIGKLSAIPNPQISFIVPTFNRLELLHMALQSLINQNPVSFPWEIIVVDNTPMDEQGNTPAMQIVRTLKNTRILYYHNRDNIGSGYNWNRGAELARGEWISFLHDDDVAFPDALQEISRLIQRETLCRKPLGYIHARSMELYGNESAAELKPLKRRVPVELTRLGTLIRGHTQTGALSCCTTIRKDVYLRFGGINYQYGLTADAILGYRIMREFTVIRSGQALGGYRWAENETLKAATLLALVEADQLFANYRYSQNRASQLWGRLFGDVQTELNIESKIHLGKKGGLQLERRDFLEKKHNVCYSVRRRLCYLIRILYRLLIEIKALFMALKQFLYRVNKRC